MKWIESQDISDWGKRIDAKGQLPRFLGRLIRATTPKDTFIEFPGGADIFVGGWDGQVIASKATAYVPEGISLWELGTEVKVRAKADGDYKKRTAEPLGYDKGNSTFIFVTTKKWKDKQKWCREKLAEGLWKDVKVYDAKNLEEWFNQAEAVVRDFAAAIRKYPFDGIQPTEDFWKEYSIGPKGQLYPEVVTVGRHQEVALIKQFLSEKQPRIVAIRASSKEEAIAFIIACAKQFNIQEHEDFFARSLIVDTVPNFRSISNNQHGLFIIPRFEEYQVLFRGVSDGHHILLPLGGDDTFNSNDIITLPRLDRDGLKNELKRYGLNDEECDRLTLESGRNITILKRLLNFPQGKVKWAVADVAREVLPALLMGRWDEAKEGDRQIISSLSGLPFEEYLEKVSRWKHSDIPLFYQIGSTWRLASPLDAWANLASYITAKDLELLEECVLTVLRNIRPSFDLPPEKRSMALFYGKESNYSEWLREGLTQTLVLIGVFGANLKLSTQSKSQTWVDSIIRKIFSEAEGKLWASLNYLMPLMAEVSPDAFIAAINQSLNKKHPEILGMFEEEPSLFTKQSHHAGLLWALEGLAWFPEFLSQVTLILGKLAALDPGGSLSNRPINSLRTIFLPWMPQTSASREDRHAAIDGLIRSYPEVAWSLMMGLLPKDHDVAHPSHKTRWRVFNISEQGGLTYGDIALDNSFYIERLILIAGTDEVRLAQLLSSSESSRMESDNRIKILSHIEEKADKIIQKEYSIWNNARSILHRHRSHQDTYWALRNDSLARYQNIFEKLYPASTIEKYKWLFEEHWPEFPEGFLFDQRSHDEQQEYINESRKNALKAIYSEHGIEGINFLSKNVKERWALGETAAFAISNEKDEFNFVTEEKYVDQQEMYSAMGFAYQKEQQGGWKWVEHFFESLKEHGFSHKSLSIFLLPLKQGKQLWDFIEQQDSSISDEYWKMVRPFLYHLTPEEKKYAVEKLVDSDRGLSAIHEASRFVSELRTESIDNLLRSAVLSKEQVHFPDYEIKQIFDELYKRKDITRTRIAELEWMYLVAFTRGYLKGQKLIIYEEMSGNPRFLIDVIKWLYKPGDENKKEADDGLSPEDKSKRAEQAYRLLSGWTQVPGTNTNGELDSSFLKNWVRDARQLAKLEDREFGADIEIGKILAQFPEKNSFDIQWPPEVICEIIDSINSDVINRNFSTALFNKRGFSSKAMFEGGERERNIAKYFHALHDMIVNRWPITASILKGLAKGYEEDAVREDERAERDSLEY